MNTVDNNFELTEDQAEILINNREFRTLVSKIVFNAHLDINKSYQDLIIDKVCDEFNVSKKELLSSSRKRSLIIPRYICFFLFSSNRKTIKMSMNDLCKFFNKKLGIVKYACESISYDRQTDKNIDGFINEVTNLIKIKGKQNA